jgi:hypothetical protein
MISENPSQGTSCSDASELGFVHRDRRIDSLQYAVVGFGGLTLEVKY